MANPILILSIKAMLLTVYPTRALADDEKVMLDAVWLDVLGDDSVTDAALQAAAREYTRSAAQFAPAPGQLRTRALELVNGDVSEVAERAWQGVIDCNYGREPQYLVDDLSKEIIRRLGGFDRMGETPTEWINKNFREPFLRMYAELKGREMAGGLLLGAGAAQDNRVSQLLEQTMQRIAVRRDEKPTDDRRAMLMKQAEQVRARELA
jgi:hypothetical protein